MVRDAIDGGPSGRGCWSAPQIRDHAIPAQRAAAVKLQRPQNVPVPVTPPPVVPKPGTFTAESEVQSQELQELAEVVGEVLKAAVPSTVKFNVRIELGGEPKPSEAKVKAINAILAKVKKGLELK